MTNNSYFRPICPVCQRSAGKYSVCKDGYEIIKCADCGLEYTAPVPSNEALVQFYSEYDDPRANSEIVLANAKRNLSLMKKYGLDESSYILDFGCGNGEFLQVAGSRCFGVELNTRGKERIFSNIDELPIDQYDFVTLWGVLEHINDLQGVMSKIISKLKKGGYFIATTVDAESTIPYHYKPPEHLTYWTRRSINFFLESHQLRVVDIQQYEMCQFGKVYLERLLSRTPVALRNIIQLSELGLPRLVVVPTNELVVVAKSE